MTKDAGRVDLASMRKAGGGIKVIKFQAKHLGMVMKIEDCYYRITKVRLDGSIEMAPWRPPNSATAASLDNLPSGQVYKGRVANGYAKAYNSSTRHWMNFQVFTDGSPVPDRDGGSGRRRLFKGWKWNPNSRLYDRDPNQIKGMEIVYPEGLESSLRAGGRGSDSE